MALLRRGFVMKLQVYGRVYHISNPHHETMVDVVDYNGLLYVWFASRVVVVPVEVE